MRSFRLCAIGFSLVFGVGCGKSDKDAIQGTWSFVSVEERGKAGPADEIKDDKITITADKFSIDQPKRERKEEATYKIDPAGKPKAIDLTVTLKDIKFEKVAAGEKAKPPEEKSVQKTMKGIYSLEGDTLKICFGEPDADRPTEFSSKDRQVVITLQRAK
jgi:uncharacterized protein (TIGR03067 family)